MLIDKYQKAATRFARYPFIGNNPIYTILGLCGEAGELANKLKKILRGDNTLEDTKKGLADELGDILWYLAATATELKLSLDDIALDNLAKLEKRLKNKTIKGKGDDR